MDYFKVLLIDNNATIIDATGMYLALKKRNKNDIAKINELNMAYLTYCTTKSSNSLVNQKNEYLLQVKTMSQIKKIKNLIATFTQEYNTGFGICFNKINKLLMAYLSSYYRLINFVRKAKTTTSLEHIKKDFANANLFLEIHAEISQFFLNNLVPGLYYTKDTQKFLGELKNLRSDSNLIPFLQTNLNFLRKLEVANETMMNNILYDNNLPSNITYQEAINLENELGQTIIDDVITNHLTIMELVSKYSASRVVKLEKELLKKNNFLENHPFSM